MRGFFLGTSLTFGAFVARDVGLFVDVLAVPTVFFFDFTASVRGYTAT